MSQESPDRTLCPDFMLPLDSLHDSQLKHVTAGWVPDCALHCLRMMARHWSQFPELTSIQGMNATGSFTPAKHSSQVVLVVRNPPANAGDLRGAGSIPGSGRSLEEEMVTDSSILACRIPWTEEPGRLQSVGSQRIHTTEAT